MKIMKYFFKRIPKLAITIFNFQKYEAVKLLHYLLVFISRIYSLDNEMR